MYRVRAGTLNRIEQPVHVQVGLSHTAVAERVRLTGSLNVQGASVRVGEDGGTCDAHIVQRPANEHRDFSAVRDEYLAEHALADVRPAFRRLTGLTPNRQLDGRRVCSRCRDY